MIKISKLIHDYIKRDDEGNAAGTVRAIDGVDLQVRKIDPCQASECTSLSHRRGGLGGRP